MTKGNKWFVTRKPSSEFQLYDFARSARQAKDMLESIADGSPIAHRSKSEGGLYNIYVKKGSVYALEKGGMIEVGDKVRAVRDGVGAFSIGKGQTGIVEEITSGGRGVIIELTNGSRRETLIEDIEKHNFRMYAEGGEIYSGGVNILKNLIDRDLIKDKNGDHYYEAEDAITDNDEKASFYALKNLWDNSLIKDESGDHFEEVTEYVGKARRHSASSYAEGGEIARKMLLQNKGVKEVIRKETVNEIRGAIEKEGYNTKGVTDDEILMIHKELQSSFYAEGGEISEEQIDEINELIAEFMRPINVDTEVWGFLKMARYDAETVNEKLEYISDARFKINVTDPMWQNLVGLQREIEEISSGSSYAEGGEIYSGGVNILKNLIDRDLIKDKNGDHYYEAEDAITDNDEKASFYALKNLWDNSLIKDESGDHFEEVTEYVGKARRHSASSYAEGGEIARKMLLQNKGVKEVIRKETVNEIRGAIEKEGYNTKGVTDDEILMIHKELQSSFYAEGGEISEEQIDEINELIAEFMRPINVDTEVWGFLKMARYDAETVNEKLEYISDARFKINVTDPMWQNLVGLQREIEEISSGSSYAEGGETKGKKKFVFSNIKGEVVSDLTLSKQESIAKETSDSLGKGFSVDKDSVGEGHFNLYLDLGNNDKYADLSGGGGEFVIMKDGRVINQGRSGLPIAYNWKTKKSYAEGGNVKSEDYWHLKTQLQKNESILEGGFHSTQRAEEVHGEIQRLKNELKKYEDSGSTYEEGGNIKGSYFEGELSFLNW